MGIENKKKTSYLPFLIVIVMVIYFAVILLGHCSGNLRLGTPSGYDPSEHGVMRGRD